MATYNATTYKWQHEDADHRKIAETIQDAYDLLGVIVCDLPDAYPTRSPEVRAARSVLRTLTRFNDLLKKRFDMEFPNPPVNLPERYHEYHNPYKANIESAQVRLLEKMRNPDSPFTYEEDLAFLRLRLAPAGKIK